MAMIGSNNNNIKYNMQQGQLCLMNQKSKKSLLLVSNQATVCNTYIVMVRWLIEVLALSEVQKLQTLLIFIF